MKGCGSFSMTMVSSLEVLRHTMILLMTCLPLTLADNERIVKLTPPASIPLLPNDETVLNCEMNLVPDRFQWRFYPLGKADASNPEAPLDLAKNFRELSAAMYTSEKKKSTLTIKLTDPSVAGDYQCLAHYGASVLAAIPDRITVITVEKFPKQNSSAISVSAGNTVVWGCTPPFSNPPASMDYTKDGRFMQNSLSTSLVLANVTRSDSGVYRCKATNTLEMVYQESSSSLQLKVLDSAPAEMPRFIMQPKTKYSVTKGERVFLECSAIGTPVPRVRWEKRYGQLDKNRMQMLSGGLLIKNFTSSDEGVYICTHNNSKGTISHEIELEHVFAPIVLKRPHITNVTEGEDLELSCIIKGNPEPQITWLLNGRNVEEDGDVKVFKNQIHFSSIRKEHAGIIQCFATNKIGTTYGSGDLHIIPKQYSGMNVLEESSTSKSITNHKHRKHKGKNKGLEMIPPSKPVITRLRDDAAMVCWTVPINQGLSIQFFKVQYKQFGFAKGERRISRWKTKDADIDKGVSCYEIGGLIPNFTYTFRIAAVYSNLDNKLSVKSDDFHLTREDFYKKNPLPAPVLTHTETVNDSAIRIFWEYKPHGNTTVNGFYVNYISASNAGDYMKAIVEGVDLNSFVISHLAPDTFYEIKMQSFNENSASEFSSLLKQKTAKLVTEPPITTTVRTKKTPTVTPTDTNFYILAGTGVIVVGLLLSIVVFLIVCRKWKQNKENSQSGEGDKPAVDEINHHIQAEANDYVVTPKNLTRNNGCVLTPNRITITANPLADADNKSQNMIEMSCLSSQNNNCATTAAAAASATAAPPASTAAVAATASSAGSREPSDAKRRKRENKRRKPNAPDDVTPSENYV